MWMLHHLTADPAVLQLCCRGQRAAQEAKLSFLCKLVSLVSSLLTSSDGGTSEEVAEGAGAFPECVIMLQECGEHVC